MHAYARQNYTTKSTTKIKDKIYDVNYNRYCYWWARCFFVNHLVCLLVVDCAKLMS